MGSRCDHDRDTGLPRFVIRKVGLVVVVVVVAAAFVGLVRVWSALWDLYVVFLSNVTSTFS